jgi:predicted PurR-regulated permease PerM
MDKRDVIQRHRVVRVLVYLVTIVVALYTAGLVWSLIIHFSDIILLFFLAWVVAFILQPLAAFLERRGLRRVIAVTLIYLSLLAITCGSIVLAVPVINNQVARVTGELTSSLAPSNLAALADQATAYLQRLGLNAKDAHAIVAQVSDRIPQWTSNLASQAADTTAALVGAVLSLLFDALIVTILSFYIMLDGDRLTESLVGRLPPAWVPDFRLFQRQMDAVFGGFLRAQLIIGLVYGALTWVVLALLGQPNGLLFAVLAGLLMLIPFIGPFLAVVPPVTLVLLQAPPNQVVWNLVVLLVALVVAQQITMQAIAPRVMSAHVGLHPLLLFAALLVGTKESGVWGAFFAGPIAAVMVAMFDVFFQRFQRVSALYPDIVPEEESEPADTGAPAGSHASAGEGNEREAVLANEPAAARGRRGSR